MTPVLVTIRSTAKDDENIPGTRELFVGCVRTMAVSQKKVWLVSVAFLSRVFGDN